MSKYLLRFIFMAVVSAIFFSMVNTSVLAYPVLFNINENSSPVFSTLIPDQEYVLKDDTNYKFYYADCDAITWICSINLAQSPDGVTWTPYVGNPVLAEGATQGEHADVHFYSDGFIGANSGTNPSAITMYYRMWYQGAAGGIGNWRYAESPDGITWYNHIAISQTGTSVTGGIDGGYGIADVVYTPGGEGGDVDKTFRIYANAQTSLAPCNTLEYNSCELVVMAYSPNGYVWTGYDPTSVGYATPVFAPTLNAGDFDSGHIGWFKVIKNSDIDWQAFYSGGTDTTYLALNGIGYATSKDGINWTRRQTFFTTDDPVAWRNQSVWMPSVVKSGINYEIFFLGSDNTDINSSDWIQWKLGRADLTPVPVLNVVKNVINTGAGPLVSSDFNLYVKNAGSNVSGSPAAGTSTPGTLYSLSAGTYVVSEDTTTSYTKSFSGDCDSSGSITLSVGDEKTCTITNTFIPPTLSYTAGLHGSITGSSTQIVNYGTDGTAVTAVPDTGYHFVDWSDASTTNPRTDTNVTSNLSISANFAGAVSSGGGGSGRRYTPPVVATTTAMTTTTTTTSTTGSTPAGYQFMNDLKFGSTGTDVRELQKRLTAEGFYTGPITRFYGILTTDAVRAYQLANGLPRPGLVGPQTRSKLNGEVGMSISAFINLLINLGIIAPEKAIYIKTISNIL